MIGFGLLGAACSTLVREKPRSVPGEPLVRDLAGVVVRGLSAAVVVFLGVQGGLAGFAAEEVDPNPYMLLFTCFVGAVFSEDVWTWAHQKLTGQLTATGQVTPTTVSEPGNPSEESKRS
jgi:hypothetical protein